jgi:Tol biopolymer transport system component
VQRRLECASIVASLLLPGAVAAAPAQQGSGGEDPSAQRCEGAPCGPALQFELELASGELSRVGERSDREGATRSTAISGDGTRIAFVSDRDLLRDGSNDDGNLEIFLLDTRRGELEQITKSEGGTGSVSPHINGAGTRIVFASDRDLIGDAGNHEGEVQLFLFDALTGGLAQLTRVDGGLASFATGLELALDDAGVRAVFASDRDLLDDGKNDDQNLEIFLLDTTTRALTQLTDTTGGEGSFAPSIDGAGTRVRWTSDRKLEPEKKDKKKPKTAKR